jgi:EF hand
MEKLQMNLRNVVVVSSMSVISLVGCRALDKGVRDADAKVASLRDKFMAFDLGCSFADISADPGAVSSSAATGSTTQTTPKGCSKAKELYAMLLKMADQNKDGKLSDDELASVAKEYETNRTAELDKNGDGKVSDDEITTWRSKELPSHEAEFKSKFTEACSALKKDDDSCRALYDVRLDDRRKEGERSGRDLKKGTDDSSHSEDSKGHTSSSDSRTSDDQSHAAQSETPRLVDDSSHSDRSNDK